jgi:hypothetical protein
MRGSVKGQTLHLFTQSGINCIGQKKFEAKDSARIALAAEGRGGISTAIAEKTGIHSIATRDNYLGKWQELGRFAKEDFGVRDLEQLTTNQVLEFLAYKIEMGVSYSHFSGYVAAIGKLENALNTYSQKFERGYAYNFRSAIQVLRQEAKAELPRFEGIRSYDNPVAVIAAIANQNYQLAARIQLESGLRIAGATNIKADQLKGLAKDVHTGKLVGLIAYKGKGGKLGVAQVTPGTYQRLTDHIREHSQFTVSKDGYRNSLKVATGKSGQSYNGSHGLRWNFAQERFKELQASGMGYEKALGSVSHEMSHNRIGITEHYLGFK